MRGDGQFRKDGHNFLRCHKNFSYVCYKYEFWLPTSQHNGLSDGKNQKSVQ